MSSAKGVWLIAEHKQGRLEDISLQLASGGRQLADKLGENVHVIVVGSNNREFADTLASYGADEVYFLDSPLLLTYSAELYVEALSELFKDKNAGVVLCGNTLVGRDLAPRLAARLKTGLVSGCIALEIDSEGSLLQTKPTYGGKVYTKLICPIDKLQLVTINPGVMEIQKSGIVKSPKIISIAPRFAGVEPRMKTTSLIKGDPKTIDVEEAEIIVAVGRGLGNASNLPLLEELAEVLGASIAASLPAVDAGWVSSGRQVGQTGKTVASRLYIACGISGSPYHTLGMKDSETVIAINTDRHAPIFKLADLGIVGDMLEVVRAITNRLKEVVKSDTQVDTGKVLDAFSTM